jgi:hypothetical protein
MTTREKLITMVMRLGMFESQAIEVVDLAIPELDKIVPEYQMTWNLPSEGYPDILYNLMMVTVKPIGLKWLEENKPEAWCKLMFMSEADAAAFIEHSKFYN